MPADTTGKAVQVLDLMLDFYAEEDGHRQLDWLWSRARPRTQFDEPWISNLKAAEQTPVRA